MLRYFVRTESGEPRQATGDPLSKSIENDIPSRERDTQLELVSGQAPDPQCTIYSSKSALAGSTCRAPQLPGPLPRSSQLYGHPSFHTPNQRQRLKRGTSPCRCTSGSWCTLAHSPITMSCAEYCPCCVVGLALRLHLPCRTAT